MEFIETFFGGMGWQDLLGYLLFALFGLAPGFSLFNFVKSALKISDKMAHTMVVVLSMLLTAGTMFLTGSLGLEGFDFTLQNIISFGSTLYVASQFAYQAFKNAQAPPLPSDIE